MQRNRELRDQLEDKKESLQKKANDAREQMSENSKRVRINNNKTARNIDTINLLTASIEHFE